MHRHRTHYPLAKLERRPDYLREAIEALAVGLVFASPFIAAILEGRGLW